MKSKYRFWQVPRLAWSLFEVAILSLTAGLIASFPSQPVFAESSSQKDVSGIAPIQSHPHGKTYSEWAATWWQWALQTPASVNPLLDKGECSVGQSGKVWFIGGTFTGSGDLIERNCTIPPGTALFFPLINAGYFAFLNDPPAQRTESYLRAQVACDAPTLLEANIDGAPVSNPAQYFEKSPLFDVQLPKDNVLGLKESDAPQLLLSPSVDQGYYLFLNPLPPGNHTIQWKAKITCPVATTYEQNNTYTITVRR